MITDGKADLDSFTLEKHHQRTRPDVEGNEERVNYGAGFADNRRSSSAAGRTNRNRKGHKRGFPSHQRGRRRSFSTNPHVDTEITVAKTEPTAVRITASFRSENNVVND